AHAHPDGSSAPVTADDISGPVYAAIWMSAAHTCLYLHRPQSDAWGFGAALFSNSAVARGRRVYLNLGIFLCAIAPARARQAGLPEPGGSQGPPTASQCPGGSGWAHVGW